MGKLATKAFKFSTTPASGYIYIYICILSFASAAGPFSDQVGLPLYLFTILRGSSRRWVQLDPKPRSCLFCSTILRGSNPRWVQLAPKPRLARRWTPDNLFSPTLRGSSPRWVQSLFCYKEDPRQLFLDILLGLSPQWVQLAPRPRLAQGWTPAIFCSTILRGSSPRWVQLAPNPRLALGCTPAIFVQRFFVVRVPNIPDILPKMLKAQCRLKHDPRILCCVFKKALL